MAAGGWKIFTAGDVLTAADTMDYLQQGVLVFNNSGARGSAIAAPAEGQFSYLKDTDVTEYYDGSTWTPVAQGGLAPATPTSIANSGGTATLSGNTVTFSGVSSVSLNGCFTGDWDNYRVTANVESSVSATGLQMRMRAGGSDNSSASAYHVMTDGIQTDAADTSIAGIGSTFTLTYTWNTRRFGTSLDIYNPNKSEATSLVGQSVGTNSTDTLFAGYDIHLFHNTDTAFDGFTLYPASGTISGTVSVYGYKK